MGSDPTGSLQAGTTMPVQHWLEFLDEALRN